MILLVNGPNVNLLGERQPEIYGYDTLADVERIVSETCAAYGVEVKAFQSNWEGALLDFLQLHRREAQGVILNPGALAQTSRALADCLRALPCPTIEVHVSNIHAREPWRSESLVAQTARGQIVGLGVAGYYHAAVHLCSELAAQAAAGDTAAPAQGYAAAAPAQGYPEAPPPAGVSAPPPGGQIQRAPTATAGGFGTGDLLPEPSQQLPVDEMPRGDYEPL
jgi:3-dehydroquinate dehydratase II